MDRSCRTDRVDVTRTDQAGECSAILWGARRSPVTHDPGRPGAEPIVLGSEISNRLLGGHAGGADDTFGSGSDGGACWRGWRYPPRACVVEFRLDPIEPFADGASFGEHGAYLRVRGVAHGVPNPDDARNAVIVNKAPRNANGLVEYDMDVFIRRPSEPGAGNGKILCDVTNRGRKSYSDRCKAQGCPVGESKPTVVPDHPGTTGFARNRRIARAVVSASAVPAPARGQSPC